MNNKKFYQYIIPSIGAMLVTGLYFVVDGIFVGRGIGSSALAAINIAVPYISILIAVCMMITMGGATITSICFGKGEDNKANNAFQVSLLMILIFSVGMTVLSFYFSENIAKILGASDLLLEDTGIYIKYFVMFAVFLGISTALGTFVRNDNNPDLAFWGMIIGAISNIFFDWILIFPLQMGLRGAAIASGLGQILGCFVLLSHFFLKKGNLSIGFPKFNKSLNYEIIKTGMPEFVTQMSQPITIFCYNLLVLRLFGEIYVSAFSIISYILVVVIGVFVGLAQGIQPLLSVSFGKGDKDDELFFFNKGLKINVILAIIIYFFMLVFGKNIISIFNKDSVLIELSYDSIKIYGISLIFAAANIVFTIYYLAIKKTRNVIFISVLRSFVANSIFIFLIPALFGLKAIWVGMIVAEAIVFGIALSMNYFDKQSLA